MQVENHDETLAQKDRELLAAVAGVTERKDAEMAEVSRQKESEIADLQHALDVCRKQNQTLHIKLQERDAVIHELSNKCQLLHQICRQRDSLQQILKLMDTINPPAAGEPAQHRANHAAAVRSHPQGASAPAPSLPVANHVTNCTTPDGVEADDESEDAKPGRAAVNNHRGRDKTSATRDRTTAARDRTTGDAQQRRRTHMRHFSISDDDADSASSDDRDSVFRKMKREKELYL